MTVRFVPFFRNLFLSLILAMIAGFSPALAQEDVDRERIENIIREYLLENPEVIAEAVQILQQRAEDDSREATKAAIRQNEELLFRDDLSIVAGNPDGDVTLVEFYDYRCPYCRRSHSDVMRLLENDDELRVVFKQFPVKDRPGERPVSLITARMAMAAEKQGLFLPFHHAMFTADPPMTEQKAYDIARDVGLDIDRLREDMKDPEITQHLRETLVLASEIGATGTPAFVIGDVLIPGAVEYDVLTQFVDLTRQSNQAQKAESEG